MLSRRQLLKVSGSAALAAAFRDDGEARVRAASEAVQRQSADAVAADEDYWREIQQAFTLDRTIINLNNGGCCPSPRVVHEAFKRYLDISNQAPVYHMWQILEPNIETVRRRLAAEFGCDAEELAITRNASEALQIAQLGIDLQRRRRGGHDQPGLRAHARHLGTARAPRRDQADEDLVSGAAEVAWTTSPIGCSRAITPATKVLHFCHITNLTGQIFPVQADLRRGAAPRHQDHRRRRARLRALSLQGRAISAATTTAPACTSGCSRRSARASSTCGARTSRRCGR